jgi:hypothetical protein
MPGGDPSKYGEFYWCIKVTASEDNDIYVYADRLEVTVTGALIAWGGNRNKGGEDQGPDMRKPVLMLAAGHWTAAFAASTFDGSAVAVEHWGGEVER